MNKLKVVAIEAPINEVGVSISGITYIRSGEKLENCLVKFYLEIDSEKASTCDVFHKGKWAGDVGRSFWEQYFSKATIITINRMLKAQAKKLKSQYKSKTIKLKKKNEVE